MLGQTGPLRYHRGIEGQAGPERRPQVAHQRRDLGQDRARIETAPQRLDHQLLALHSVVVAGELAGPSIGQGLVAVHVLNPGLEVQVDVARSFRYAIPVVDDGAVAVLVLGRALWTARMVDDAGWYVDGDSAEVVDEVHEAHQVDLDDAVDVEASEGADGLLEGRDPAQVVVRRRPLLVVREVLRVDHGGFLPEILEHVRPRVRRASIGDLGGADVGVMLGRPRWQRDAVHVAWQADHRRAAGLQIDVEEDHRVRPQAHVPAAANPSIHAQQQHVQLPVGAQAAAVARLTDV